MFMSNTNPIFSLTTHPHFSLYLTKYSEEKDLKAMAARTYTIVRPSLLPKEGPFEWEGRRFEEKEVYSNCHKFHCNPAATSHCPPKISSAAVFNEEGGGNGGALRPSFVHRPRAAFVTLSNMDSYNFAFPLYAVKVNPDFSEPQLRHPPQQQERRDDHSRPSPPHSSAGGPGSAFVSCTNHVSKRSSPHFGGEPSR